MADVSGGKSALLSLAVRCDPTTRFEEEPGLLGAASLTKFSGVFEFRVLGFGGLGPVGNPEKDPQRNGSSWPLFCFEGSSLNCAISVIPGLLASFRILKAGVSLEDFESAAPLPGFSV